MTPDLKLAKTSISEMLATHGFRARKYGIYTKSQSDDVLSWIGVNEVTRYGCLEVSMAVGLRFSQVEARVHALLGEKDDGLTPATISGNVGYVGGQGHYRDVVITTDEGICSGVMELERLLVQWGLPFLENNGSLPQLLDLLLTVEYTIAENVAYRLPVVLSLLGQPAKAFEYVSSKMASEAAETDPESERYRRFAEAFLLGC